MKKIITSMCMLLCALLTMAQTPGVVFEEKFAGTLGNFTVEGFNGTYNDIWSGDYDCVKADAYRKISEIEPLTNYLVSPEITLEDKTYKVRFEHCCDYFKNPTTQATFVVREVGGSWKQIEISQYGSGMFTVADQMTVPTELQGKAVQFGFKYSTPQSTGSGIWRIKNFVVEEAVDRPAEKAEPMIAFGVYQLSYDLASHEPFESPKLFNPFGLTVTYTSTDENVATVDANGTVTVKNEGETTIVATTEENDTYKAGSDQYVLTVTDERKTNPELKDPEIAFSQTLISCELCNRESFEAPQLHNPYGVEVSYYSNAPEVVSVDEQTGEVTLLAEGTAVVSVYSTPNEAYYEGFAQYTLNVLDHTVLYVGKDFGENQLQGFTEEGEAAGQYIWMPTVYGGWLQANGYKKVDQQTETYMVSPAITLDKNGNTLSFVHTLYQFYDFDDRYHSATVYLREVGGEWQPLEIPYPLAEFEQVEVDRIAIPAALNGKTIQVGFNYTCDGTVEGSGTWAVKDIYVRRVNLKPAAPLSFGVETAQWDMSGETPLTVPALDNPDELAVTYSSSDAQVAEVDAMTGKVTVKSAGSTVISATSDETEAYAPTTVSYTLTVESTATGITTVTEGTARQLIIYDLEGRRVYAPTHGVYIVNGKKCVIP